jgi:hypothetical protein
MKRLLLKLTDKHYLLHVATYATIFLVYVFMFFAALVAARVAVPNGLNALKARGIPNVLNTTPTWYLVACGLMAPLLTLAFFVFMFRRCLIPWVNKKLIERGRRLDALEGKKVWKGKKRRRAEDTTPTPPLRRRRMRGDGRWAVRRRRMRGDDRRFGFLD